MAEVTFSELANYIKENYKGSFKAHNINNQEFVVYQHPDNDVAVFIVNTVNESFGLNYVWGGMRSVTNNDPLFIEENFEYSIIDEKAWSNKDLRKEINTNDVPSEVVNDINELINKDIKNKSNTAEKKYKIIWDAEVYDNQEPFIGTEDEVFVRLFGTRNVVDMQNEDMKWAMEMDKTIQEKGKADYNVGLMGVTELTVMYYIDEVQNFIDEYRGYLIGKNTTYGKGILYKITDVVNLHEYNKDKSIGLTFENGDVTSFDLEDSYKFIDGEEIKSAMGDISLILQEENNEVSEELKSLIGKTVDLSGGGKDILSKITGIEREIVEFEGTRTNDFKILLDGEESYFIHPDAITEFIIGNETGALLKSNDKGGTIQLINEETIPEKLPEEPIIPELITSPNHPEFIYYIVDKDSNKIKEGFQYKEDGRKNTLKLREVGINAILVPKRELIPGFQIDPELESSWDTNITDQAVISEAFAEYEEIKEPSDDELPDNTEVLFWYLKRKIDKLESALSLRKMKSAEDHLNKVNKIFTQLKKQR